MTTVGATTHDRKYVASVTDITATDAATPARHRGCRSSGPTDGAFPLVYAGAAPYNNPLCGQPDDATPRRRLPRRHGPVRARSSSATAAATAASRRARTSPSSAPRA